MATSFVAGLASATILTLLVTPANYELLEQFKSFFKKRFRQDAAAEPDAEVDESE
jgi:hypothetical protein